MGYARGSGALLAPEISTEPLPFVRTAGPAVNVQPPCTVSDKLQVIEALCAGRTPGGFAPSGRSNVAFPLHVSVLSSPPADLCAVALNEPTHLRQPTSVPTSVGGGDPGSSTELRSYELLLAISTSSSTLSEAKSRQKNFGGDGDDQSPASCHAPPMRTSAWM